MLPSEFLLFKFGVNDSDKGAVVLDKRGAAAMIRHRGTRDVMIDLEHASIDGSGDQDARGWGKLEVRDDGVYVTNVRWTPDGARRLEERTQRYVSPAFYAPDGRVTALVNVALTSLPAMRSLPALVAASVARRHGVAHSDTSAITASMDLEALKAALGLTPDASEADLLGAMGDASAELSAMLAEVMPEASADAAEAAEGLNEAAEAAEEAMPDPEEVAALEEMAAKLGYSVSKGGGEEEKMSTDEDEKEEMSTDEDEKIAASVGLAEEVSELRKRLDARDRADVLRAYSARMTPGQTEWAKSQPLAVLRSFVETLPEAPPRTFSAPKRSPKRSCGDMDEAVARAAGVSIDIIRAQREKESNR